MYFDINLTKRQESELKNKLSASEYSGDLPEAKRYMGILGFINSKSLEQVAFTLQVSIESIRIWVIKYLAYGISGLKSKKSPGRPPKLTKTQRKKLSEMIEKGPESCGFPGSCWRAPLIQHLIQKEFGVFYSVIYLSELLKNMGFSFQKATFVAANRDAEKRQEWVQKIWPTILKLSKKKGACILFGDEASFPQWGTLNYTWAPVGQQPVIQTSGTRKSYKVFGLIDYWTGRFYSQGYEGKLNSESYMDFLSKILKKIAGHIILIQDGAKYHTSVLMKEFFNKHKNRISVFQLPSFSPDYNPIEKLWKKVKQAGTHLKYFPTFDSLIDKVEDMLFLFSTAKKEVLKLFGFYDDLSKA